MYYDWTTSIILAFFIALSGSINVLNLELHAAGGSGLQEICMLGEWERVDRDTAYTHLAAEQVHFHH